jgi:hypothetical protein
LCEAKLMDLIRFVWNQDSRTGWNLVHTPDALMDL